MTAKSLSRYMARIGRKGGLKRKLTTEEARKMAQKSAESRKAKMSKLADLCPNCGHDQDGELPTHCESCAWPLPKTPVIERQQQKESK